MANIIWILKRQCDRKGQLGIFCLSWHAECEEDLFHLAQNRVQWRDLAKPAKKTSHSTIKKWICLSKVGHVNAYAILYICMHISGFFSLSWYEKLSAKDYLEAANQYTKMASRTTVTKLVTNSFLWMKILTQGRTRWKRITIKMTAYLSCSLT
jgi:hypothetical protein